MIKPMPVIKKKTNKLKNSMTSNLPKGVCPSCSELPAGSMEIGTLLLVLVFSLSAVLVTSVTANRIQAQKLDQLQAKLDVSR